MAFLITSSDMNASAPEKKKSCRKKTLVESSEKKVKLQNGLAQKSRLTHIFYIAHTYIF